MLREPLTLWPGRKQMFRSSSAIRMKDRMRKLRQVPSPRGKEALMVQSSEKSACVTSQFNEHDYSFINHDKQ